jgi:hypothetical protein
MGLLNHGGNQHHHDCTNEVTRGQTTEDPQYIGFGVTTKWMKVDGDDEDRCICL